MLKVAVVEDNNEQTCEIERQLKQFFTENKTEYLLDCYSSGIDLLNAYNAQYQLILLDICMPGLNGLEVAKELRNKNSTASIVFMTNMPKYAINGYEVEAVGFLVKPVKYTGLCNTLRRVLSHISDHGDVAICVTTRQGVITISSTQLLYVESKQHDLIYVADKFTVRQRGSLKDAEEKLTGCGFKRCSHSYLVNLKFVRAFQGNTLYIGEHEIPISRGRKKEFISTYLNFMGGGASK